METKLYKESEDAFVKIDGSWMKASSVEAVRPTVSGRTRVYLSSGNFIDVGSASGSITPDDVIKKLKRAWLTPNYGGAHDRPPPNEMTY